MFVGPMNPPSHLLQRHPEVEQALAAGKPVVALESTLIAHGLPRPQNLDVAREVETIVRTEGAVPATIAVLRGVVRIGLDAAALEHIATAPHVTKLSARDLPVALGLGIDGATTVAGTAALAAAAGIRLFATGGLGGVHRGARESWDESADLATLGRTPVAVVCAGVKSILDIGATLERLESLGVAVVGYRTRRFPSFYLADSGLELDWSVESEDEAAAIVVAQQALGRVASHLSLAAPGSTSNAARAGSPREPSLFHDGSARGPLGTGAVVFAHPIPESEQLDPALHDRVLAEGLAEVERQGIRGKAVTPFLLDYFARATGGESLRVNRQIICGNARLAARIAVAVARRTAEPAERPV